MAVAELFQKATPRYPELQGKVAIVTGSSQGIGLGIAVRLAAEQMRVVIAGLDGVACAVNELRGLGVDAHGVQGDLGEDDQIARLVDETVDVFGSVDILVNNAAILDRTQLAKMDVKLLDRQIAVNMRAPLLLAQRAAKVMSGGGSIINISSVGGLRAHEEAFPYDVTKGAIDSMTRALAIDLAVQNIRVNAVAPGSVMSWRVADHLNTEPDSAYHTAPKRIPLGRRASVLEVGGVVAFLASEDAAYITGQVIYVDGGLTVQLSPRGQPV